MLFLGAPGTGKTMLSKGIATSFNCPFVSIPGSGFAQTFIGMDAVLVRYLAMKAKRLARKWGGQCIVFIDEIDAVGMRRQALGSGYQPYETTTIHDSLFYGPDGALTWDGDLVLETAAWRDRLFQMRAEPRGPVYPPAIEKLAGAIRNMMIPGMMGGGGGLALNQLLVVMDGIDDPPLMKRMRTKRINTFLDALYIVPRKLGKLSLRLPPPKPNKEEIYFIGACNVSLERSTRRSRARAAWAATSTSARPRGRTGATSSTSTSTKVAHDPELDKPERRDELARITNGYSPAMIDQVCSMALTYAHSDGREHFEWEDLVEAMTTVEAGVAIGQPYPKHEERAIAIHEAGHAVCGHLFTENRLSTRLSIRKRGSSGGHHQAMEIEDRFGHWRSEQVGDLIWGARRDGGRARLLRPEHDRRRRRRALGHRPRRRTWSASTRWRRRRSTSPTASPTRAPRGGRGARDGALREDRLPDHAPLRRRDDGRQPVARRSATRRSEARSPACSARRSWSPTTRPQEPRGHRLHRRRLVAQASSTATTWSRLLEDARLRKPEIDVLDEDAWPMI